MTTVQSLVAIGAAELARQESFLQKSGLSPEDVSPSVGKVYQVNGVNDVPVWLMLVRWNEDLFQFQACPVSDFPIAAGPDVPLGSIPGYGDLIAHAGSTFWIDGTELLEHCTPVFHLKDQAAVVRQRLADLVRGREAAFPHADQDNPDWDEHMDEVQAACSRWL